MQLCTPLLLSGFAAAQNLAPNGRELPLPDGFLASSGKSDSDAIPQWHAIWAVVFVNTIVGEEDSPGSGISALKHTFALEDGTAAALFRHVQSSLETRKRVASAARDAMCNSREQIVTKEDLAREVGKIRKASDDARAEAVAQLEAIVGGDAYERIIEASNQVRSSMLTLDVDLITVLSKEPPSAVVERTEQICRRSTVRQSPTL